MLAIAFIAGFAGLISNGETIFNFILGKQSLDLTTTNTADAVNDFDDTDDIVYLINTHMVKERSGVLHDCKFSVWVDGLPSEIQSPKEGLLIPDGSFNETMLVYFKTKGRAHFDGTISLICDSGGSGSVAFKIRPMMEYPK